MLGIVILFSHIFLQEIMELYGNYLNGKKNQIRTTKFIYMILQSLQIFGKHLHYNAMNITIFLKVRKLI